jgi:hypothetical protein
VHRGRRRRAKTQVKTKDLDRPIRLGRPGFGSGMPFGQSVSGALDHKRVVPIALRLIPGRVYNKSWASDHDRTIGENGEFELRAHLI